MTTPVDLVELSEGLSTLTYLASDGVWLCSDVFGAIQRLDSKIESVEVKNEAISFLAVSPAADACAVAVGDTVSLHDYPGFAETNPLLVRNTLPITHLEFGRDGENIFIGSEEPNVKVHNIKEGKNYTIETNSKGVKALALNQDNDLLCIIDTDGLVTIQQVGVSLLGVYDSSDAVKRVAGLIPKDLVRKESKCQVSWSPSLKSHGHLLAIPGGKCIHFLYAPEGPADGNWKEAFLTADPTLEESHGGVDINMVAFSRDGNHLVSSDVSGAIVLWSVADTLTESKMIRKFKCSPSESLRGIGWGLKDGDNYLAVMTSTSWSRIDDVVPPKQAIASTAAVQIDAVAALPAASSSSSSSSSTSSSSSVMDVVTEADVEAEEPVTTATTSAVVETIEPEKTHVSGTGGRLKKNEAAANNDDDDDDDVFNDIDAPPPKGVAATESVAEIKRRALNVDDNAKEDDNASFVDEDDDAARGLPGLSEEAVLRLVQEGRATLPTHAPVQPGSTKRDDKGQRYLVWNSVGNITSREQNDSNRIEIRFADTMSQNRQEGFSDTDGFTMASLAYEGAVFATDPEVLEEDDPTPARGSVVHYHAFLGFLSGANESFTYPLPSGEAAMAVAVGEGWCAVATSKGFLRIFSSTGIQISVTCLTGPVVCLCGFRSQLAIASAVESTSNLHLELLSITPFAPGCSRCVVEIALPLSAKSTLSWMGFDVDTQVLATIDSSGLMRMLMRPFGWKWMPVLDIARAKKSPEHVFWPTMVKGSKLVYVLLNGESRPAIYPQPVTAVKTLRVPIIEVRAGKDRGETANEKAHLNILEGARASHLESFKLEGTVFGFMPLGIAPEAFEKRLKDQENEADKSIVWLLQNACNLNRVSQALDLTYKLRTELGLKASMMVANKFGMQKVAQKLQELLDSRFPNVVEEQEEYVEDNSYQPHAINSHPQQQEFADDDGDEYVGAQQENAENTFPDDGHHSTSKTMSHVTHVTPSVGAAINPFAKTGSPTAGKRKAGAYDSLKNLKGSPSPKKPMQRQSSFVTAARNERQIM